MHVRSYSICLSLSDLFHITPSSSIHVAAHGNSLLPFCGRGVLHFVYVCPPHHAWTWVKVHSSADGHLGFLYILSLVNSTGMNIGGHVFFRISSFTSFRYVPSVGLLGHTPALFSVFWESSILFSILASCICIPTNSAWGFPFPASLPTCYSCSFWWGSFWQVWGDFSLCLWFAFSQWLAMLSIFSCACPLWKNVYSFTLIF